MENGLIGTVHELNKYLDEPGTLTVTPEEAVLPLLNRTPEPAVPVIRWTYLAPVRRFASTFSPPSRAAQSQAKEEAVENERLEFAPGVHNNSGASPFNMQAALNDPDSKERRQLLADIDAMAEVLKIWQNTGRAAIFQPVLSGSSGGWSPPRFSFGSEESEIPARLYRFMFDRLVNHHGLKGFLWAYPYQTKRLNDMQPHHLRQLDLDFLGFLKDGDLSKYPGDEYVDLVIAEIPRQLPLLDPVYRSVHNRFDGKERVVMMFSIRDHQNSQGRTSDLEGYGVRWPVIQAVYEEDLKPENQR
jgi:hypothetical protein